MKSPPPCRGLIFLWSVRFLILAAEAEGRLGREREGVGALRLGGRDEEGHATDRDRHSVRHNIEKRWRDFEKGRRFQDNG